MPSALRRILVRRVSSQRMRSAEVRTATARAVMSPRLPIGVDTTASSPLTTTEGWERARQVPSRAATER
jgi:hypothetical protein